MLKNANDFILRYDMFYDMLFIKYNPQSFTRQRQHGTQHCINMINFGSLHFTQL